MGRLYDQQDLRWNTQYWTKQEQLLHREIANGLIQQEILKGKLPESELDDTIGILPASILDEVTETESGRTCRIREVYEKERLAERMKLLRTGRLLAEMSAWEALFKACPHCKQVKGKKGGLVARPCIAHAEGYQKAKSAVWFAGERNIAERNARGQRRADGVATAKEILEGELPSAPEGLNKWEAQYLRESSGEGGYWTREEANAHDTTHDYPGFLRMLFQTEDMTEAEYLTEIQRLRSEGLEREQTAKQWAGGTITSGMQKGDRLRPERFRKDTRFNITAV